MPLPKENYKYTYADYITWPENERWDIIDGIPYMQAAPTWQHQAISIELASQFNVYLRGKSCRVFAAPFDLSIPSGDESDESIFSYVGQPDIVIVCDKNKLRKTGYFGVPRLVIEISSPSTAKTDKIKKFEAFEKAGIKEYWIVEPDSKLVNVFILQENNRYGRPEIFSDENTIQTSIFPNLIIDLALVFSSI